MSLWLFGLLIGWRFPLLMGFRAWGCVVLGWFAGLGCVWRLVCCSLLLTCCFCWFGWFVLIGWIGGRVVLLLC